MAHGDGDSGITRTYGEGPAEFAPQHLFGIEWLVPVGRFDPIEHGAIVGRAEGCDVQLQSDEVSRQHARFVRGAVGWQLSDCGSKNGSWLNGVRVSGAELHVQDVLRIGDWVGIVDSVPPSAVAAVPRMVRLSSGILLSPATLDALPSFRILSSPDLAVAIYGETGTGKEGLARAIHQSSGRLGPLVAVNCATLPEGMAESLLFGHLKGAFTGAHQSREGYIRSAHGGTLLLDEIADLPLTVQAKLLRVLEQHHVTPLGASTSVPVDFRVIVACQEPLSELVEQGSIRADLYARVNTVELCLPPLRQRRQEVKPLLDEFLAARGRVPALDSRAVEALCVYNWPYNVRELQQVAALLSAEGTPQVGVDDLPQRFRRHAAGSIESAREVIAEPSARRHAWLMRHARELEQLRVALEKHGGNVSAAALDAGVPRHRARRLLAAGEERGGARGQ